MNSFRSSQRAWRNGTAGNTSSGGTGYLFCERHRERYRNDRRCPVCDPTVRPVRPMRRR
ncbi:hypothetical protein ABIE56_000933 [Luteibacter sp. 621]|uniref:hypothetical protein n=1 Tax=Luteibacter sp. 621 TaxID=3373916 RepID=UPI003D25C804